jgi:hypothetical protein
MRSVGSTNPMRDISYLANQVDALALHQLANPDEAFDPQPALVTLVTALVGTNATAPRRSHRRSAHAR